MHRLKKNEGEKMLPESNGNLKTWHSQLLEIYGPIISAVFIKSMVSPTNIKLTA